MFNKFKINQSVKVRGYGKNDNKYYNNKVGRVIEKDSFFCDYLIKFNDGTSDWLDEKCLTSIRKYRRREQKK